MLKQLTLALGFALIATKAPAHSNGHATITPAQALEAALYAAGYLATQKVDRDWSPLPQSWASLPNSSAKLMAEVDGDFVVALENAETGETLYILLAGNGAILDANFTGTFPYVWDIQTNGVLEGE